MWGAGVGPAGIGAAFIGAVAATDRATAARLAAAIDNLVAALPQGLLRVMADAAVAVSQSAGEGGHDFAAAAARIPVEGNADLIGRLTADMFIGVIEGIDHRAEDLRIALAVEGTQLVNGVGPLTAIAGRLRLVDQLRDFARIRTADLHGRAVRLVADALRVTGEQGGQKAGVRAAALGGATRVAARRSGTAAGRSGAALRSAARGRRTAARGLAAPRSGAAAGRGGAALRSAARGRRTAVRGLAAPRSGAAASRSGGAALRSAAPGPAQAAVRGLAAPRSGASRRSERGSTSERSTEPAHSSAGPRSTSEREHRRSPERSTSGLHSTGGSTAVSRTRIAAGNSERWGNRVAQ